jgi:cytoskeletal protein RodZ
VSIGSVLREKREARKLSVAEVAAETRINKKYIQALEDGNYLLIPSQVYAKGFLKAYAEFLGLDPKNLLAELINYYKSREEGRKAAVSAQKIKKIISFPKTLKLPTMPAIPAYKFDMKMMLTAVISVFVLLFLISVYGYISSHQKRAVMIEANPPVVAATEKAKVPPKKITKKSVEEKTVKETAIPEGKIELRIETTKRSHLSVSSGSMELYSGTLQPGAKLRFIGREIKVKAGDGGGVKVYVNGKFLGVMGEEGVATEKTYKASE